MATENLPPLPVGDNDKEIEGPSESASNAPKKRGLAVRSLHADNISNNERAAIGEHPTHHNIIAGKENTHRLPFVPKKDKRNNQDTKKDLTKYDQITRNTPKKKLRSKKTRIIDQKPVRTPVAKRGTTLVKVEPYRSPLQVGIHNLAEEKIKQEPHLQSLSVSSPKSKPSRAHMVIRTPPRRVPIHEQHRTRLIKSGPMRVPVRRTPTKHTESIASTRVGCDGTCHTPSRELLKPTACSLSKQVPSHIRIPIEKSRCTPPPELHTRLSPTRSHCDRTQHKVSSPCTRSKNIPVHTYQHIPVPVHPRTHLSPRRTNTNVDKGSHLYFIPPTSPGSQLSLEEEALVSDLDSLAIHTDIGNDASVDSSIVNAMEVQYPGTPSMDELDEERHGCEDPVAITLLNGGKEQLGLLLERDTTSRTTLRSSASVPTIVVAPNLQNNSHVSVEGEAAERTDSDDREKPAFSSLHIADQGPSHAEAVDERDSHSAAVGDAYTSPLPRKYGPLRKVSSRLLDVMGDDAVASLHRPIAIIGRPQGPDELKKELHVPSNTT